MINSLLNNDTWMGTRAGSEKHVLDVALPTLTGAITAQSACA